MLERKSSMGEKKINGETPEEQPKEKFSVEIIDDAEAKVKAALASGLDTLRAGSKKVKTSVDAAKAELEKQKAELNRKKAEGQAAAQKEGQPTETSETSSATKRKKKIVVIGGAILLALAIFIFLISARKSVNMKDYITVSFSGLDGKGIAHLDVDYRALSQIADFSGENSGSESAIFTPMWPNALPEYAPLENAISCRLSMSDQLANGDTIYVDVTADQNRCKELGLKIKNQRIPIKVDGLTGTTTFDAFADIEITFEGIAPCATADLINNSRDEAAMSYNYILENSFGLRNGDIVTVTIDSDNLDEVAMQTGKIPAQLSKEYVVGGLNSYIDKLSQISDETMNSMIQEAENAFLTRRASYWEDAYVTLGQQGCYLFFSDPDSDSVSGNQLFLVYTVTYHRQQEDGTPFEFTYYRYTRFSNLYNDENGNTVVDMTLPMVPRRKLTFTAPVNGSERQIADFGYRTLAELYKDCLAEYGEGRVVESSVQ